MSSDPDTILLEAEEHMQKAVDFLKSELRGVRTGRASTGLVEFLTVDYYGSPTGLKALAAISIPEPSQILIKPFDVSAIQAIKQAIEKSDLGMAPIVEAKQIRLNVPALTKERRQQLVAHTKKLGEQQKVVIRNVRRDANKHADALAKQEGQHFSEDQIADCKDAIQDLVKKYEKQIDELIDAKTKEIMEV